MQKSADSEFLTEQSLVLSIGDGISQSDRRPIVDGEVDRSPIFTQDWCLPL